MSFQKFGIAPTSVKLRVKLFDSSVSTGAGKTGIAFNTTGLSISIIQNGQGANGAALPTIYSSAGSTIESISALGTYVAPTAGKCRFREVSAGDLPGIYEIHFADPVYSFAGYASIPMTLLVSIHGVTDLAEQDLIIECTDQSASQSSVDVIDSIVDAILVDTGSTMPGTLASIEGKADTILVDTADMQPRVTAIEVDTGTTIPGQLDSMSGASFSSATDSLEAIRDRGDAAWTSGGAAPTVEQIRTEMDNNSTQLAAIVEDTGTTIPNQITALNNLSADAVWDEVASGHTTAGTFGEYFYRMMSGVGTRIKMFLAQLNIVATGNDSAIDAAGSGTGAGMKNTGGATGAGQKNIATNNIGLYNVGSTIGQQNEGDNIGLANIGSGSSGNGMQNYGGGFGIRNIATSSGHGMSNEGAGAGKDLSSPDNDLGITAAPTVAQIRTEMDANSTKLNDILVDTGTTIPAQITAEHSILDSAIGVVDSKVDGIDTNVDTIDSNVDAILVDTGTTLPGTLTSIESKVDIVDTNVDAILVDTADMQPKLDIIGVTIQAISLKTAPLSYDAFGYVNADAQAIDDSETTSTRLRQAMLGTIHGKVNATPGTSTTLIVKELTNDSEADLNVSDLIINRTLTFISGACKGQMIGITSQTAAVSDPITLTTTEMVNYTNISENDEFVIT